MLYDYTVWGYERAQCTLFWQKHQGTMYESYKLVSLHLYQRVSFLQKKSDIILGNLFNRIS